MKLLLSVLALGLTMAATAGDDAAILATLTGARRVQRNGDGFQLVGANGQWMRAVKSVDGGYMIFSTEGSARLFRTQHGYGFTGASNDTRRITTTPRGFVVQSATGSSHFVKTGSAWIDQNSTNQFRVLESHGEFTTAEGPLTALPPNTAYELFQQRQPSPDDARSGVSHRR